MEEMEKSSQDKLSKLIQAVLEGDNGKFKKILSTFDNSKYNIEGTLQNQNLLILACKSNRIEILKYLLSREGVRIICKANGAFYKPEEEDSAHHNIFYYSIRSGNVSMIDYLVRYWPEKYFDSHPDVLEYLISSSYQEILINKIRLSHEMKFYVESKLLDLRFFQTSPDTEIYNYKNIKGRIALLIDNITNLLNFPNVDEKYLYTAVFVAKNIHILKSILKTTYKVFPWVEIEFCLNFFISSHFEEQEIHLFFKHILTTSRMQYHLKHILNKLGELNQMINSRNLPELCKLPEENRDKIVDNIINNFAPFKDLYKDYQLIRDVYSLRQIMESIELALTVDPSSGEGHLVIFRTLQILGENLKYCLEAPKLSLITVDLILLSLPLSLRNIVLKLRNAPSPAIFLAIRLEFENRCEDFSSIQGDLQNLSEVISKILLKRKKDTLLEICSEISQLTDYSRLKEMLLTVKKLSLNQDGNSLFQMLEHNRMNNLFIELERKLNFENKHLALKVLNQIKCVLQNNVQKNNHNSKKSFVNNLSEFLKLAFAYNFKQSSEQFCKKFKRHTDLLFNLLSCNWNSFQLRFLRKCIMDLLFILKFGIQEEDMPTLKIICELFSCIGMGDHQRNTVHELLEEITGRQLFISVNNFDNYYFKTNFNLISEELKNLLDRNGIKSKLNYSFTFNLSNKQLLACFNLLLIDLLSLTNSQGTLGNNLLSLDDSPFILTGQKLLQLLADCDNLLDVLMNNSDQAFSIFLNAIAYVTGTSNLCKKSHLLWEYSFKPKSLYDKDICTIDNKIMLFLSLEEGDLASVKIAVKNGADYFARDFHLLTCFHFAAKAPGSNATEYTLSHNAKVDFKNKLNQSPLHIAAEFGRTEAVSLLLKKGLYINAEDCEGKTPMHLASLNGHTETVSILINNKADLNRDDKFKNTPLHYAIMNNHLDVAMLLLKGKPYSNIDLTKRLFPCLHLASEKGLLDLVKHLVYQGANVNARAADGSVALHSAATNGYLDIVEFLIMKGTNVNSKSLNGFTPLHNAAEADNCDVVNFLLKNKAEINSLTHNNVTPLSAASELGCNKVVKLLLKCGGDAEQFSIHGLNPLLVATANNHKNVVESLVLHKVNVNVKAADNYSSLHLAAKNGSNDVVLMLVNHKALVNARTKSEGRTPLHIAAAFGKSNIIETLIDCGADLNVQDNDGNTPLHVALLGGHEVVSILLKKKANVSILNKELISPLHTAVAVGSKESVALLLDNIPCEYLNTSNDTSVLHCASYLGRIDVVKALLKHGAKVNDLNEDGKSPLYSAVEGGNNKVVGVLIAHGASLESSEHHLEMLGNAVKYNHKEILETLLSKGIDISEIGPDALLAAIIIGYKDIVEVLLNNRVDPNASIPIERDIQIDNLICYELFDFLIINFKILFLNNIECMKPLHMACAKGRKEIVEILLAKGANPNCILSHSGSPLHVAAYFGYADIVQVLVDNGGEINSRNKKNMTPFILAVSQGHLSVVEVILKHEEVNINSIDSDGWTPLHVAAQAGNLNIISLLIEKGGDIRAKSHEGPTPAHIASKYGHKHIVNLFLSLGMSVEELDAYGRTLLHYAAKSGQLKVIEDLVSKQANINSVDLNGCTPLHFASSFGNKYIVEFLLKSGAIFDSVDCNNSKPFEVARSKDIYNLLLFTDGFFKAVKQNKCTEVVSYIKAGAFVNAMDSDSGTVVHYAAWKGYDKIIEILLENKCSPNIPGKSGYTPMHYAAKFSHFNVVLSLLRNGAVFNALSLSGKTPLDMATDKRIISLLCLITKCFLHVKNGNFNVINNLKTIKDLNIIKALMKAHDKDDKHLIVAAIKHKFVRLIDLEKIFMGDIFFKVASTELLCMQERFDEALDLCNSILEFKKDLLGDCYPSILQIEIIVVKFLLKKQKYIEALELSEKIYKKMKEFLGIDHKGTLDIRYLISIILYNMGKHTESIVILEDVIEKQEQTGLDTPDMTEMKHLLACSLAEIEKHEESLKINYELFNQRNKTVGFYDLTTLKFYESIATSLANMGKPEEALNIYQKVYDAKVKVLGASHSITQKSLHNIAAALLAIRKFDEALRIFNEVLEKQKADGNSYCDVFLTLANIAEVHMIQRKVIKALSFFREAYALGVKNLGPHHVRVLSIISEVKTIKECLNFTADDNIDDIVKNIQLKLFSAASVGDPANVTDLISIGVFVNPRDDEGRTPLHFGVNSGSVEVVTLLLEGGADATLTSNKGNTPLHIAISKSNILLIELLLKHVNDSKLNSFINCKTKASGMTALHIAARNAFIDGIKILLEHGAIYNMANREGKTPLDIAKDDQVTALFRLIHQFFSIMKSGGENIVEKLMGLEAGILKCVVNARNIQGKTLVQFAIENDLPDLAGEILNFMKSN